MNDSNVFLFQNFVADFGSTLRDEILNDAYKISLADQVICQHFIRNGFLEMASQLAEEAGVVVQQDCLKPFAEINRIVGHLRQVNISNNDSFT